MKAGFSLISFAVCLNSAYFQPFIQIDTLFTSCYNSSGA
jgi:hypothetical protein